MSDFEQPPYAPLPPAPGHPTPPAAPVNPFGLPPAPPFQAASGTGSIGTGYSVAGYPLVRGGPSAKPPRPAVKGGSMLLIAGGVGLVIGSLLPWVTVAGQRFNGFADEPISLDGGSNGGPAMAFLAALLIGFGIAQLAARKVLAVAILAVVCASFAVIGTLAEMGDVADVVQFADLLDAESSWGLGVPVLAMGSLVGLGGAIATLAKRRR
ncbi:MAG: hypothetical protein KAY11_18100 [Ilumatobacteraceae bacterium]|jgi:hypothetical protein|nr:hypothetical protein [Acidimicrobiaceae bacterium]MBP6489384.1 hypothetical protein [Ilumatobacteraceae bacterium]MBK9969287.1 hypothetical protein [Acidimicrobiaceae bacterium]MBP7888713.1 hypothetical protein [Ilumatobacteraceae bacterium]MBP8211482.1 hypothetical protein [Ilumatobacteraceae bacterium]